MRVLLIEDDTMLGESLARSLEREGYATDWVTDAGGAETALLTTPYDLAVLDLGLPDRDGHQVLASLRGRGDDTLVLILTARDDAAERVRGLDGGADDYLTKPFDLDELLARMRALARRRGGRSAPKIHHLGLEIDPATHQVTYRRRSLQLPRREYALLLALLEHPGRVWTRERLIERLYGNEQSIASNVIEVHVHGLRRKICSDYIVSLRGVGYAVKT